MLIRNKTASNIEINSLGITVIVGEDFDLSNTPASDIQEAFDLHTHISNLEIVVMGPDTEGELTIELDPTSTEVNQSIGRGHSHNEYATKDEVTQKISDLVSGAPEQLNTLNELAAQLQNDGDAITSINNKLAEKSDKTHTHQDILDSLSLKANDADVDTLADMIDEKADKSVTTGHNSRIQDLENNSATKTEVASNLILIDGLNANKADKTTTDALQVDVNKRAHQVDLDGAFSEIQTLKDGKAENGHDHPELATKTELDNKEDKGHLHDSEYHKRAYVDQQLSDLKTSKADLPYVDGELAKKTNIGHLHEQYYDKTEIDELLSNIQGGSGQFPVETIDNDTEIKFNRIYIVENKSGIPLKLTLPSFHEGSDANPAKGQHLYVLARYGRFDIYSNPNMMMQRIIRKGGMSESGGIDNSVKLAKAVSDFAWCRIVMINESGADLLLVDWGMTLNDYVMPVSEMDAIMHFTCEDGTISGNTILDQSGYNHDGFMCNISQTEDGFIGEKALYAYDKNKPSITIPDSEYMKANTLGIFCKFKLEEIDGTRCLFSKKKAFHWIFKNGTPEIFLKTWNGSVYAKDKNLIIEPNKYYQCGMTYDGERLKVFMDGVKIIEVVKWSSFRNDSTDPLYLFFRYSLRNYMSGMIDEFIWFRKAPSEVEAISLTSQPQTLQQAVRIFDYDPTMIIGDSVVDQTSNTINGVSEDIIVDYGIFTPAEAKSVQRLSMDDDQTYDLDCGSLSPVPGKIDGARRFNKAQITIENAELNTEEGEWITVKFWAPRAYYSNWEMLVANSNCNVVFKGNYIGLNTWASDITGANIADITGDGKFHQYIVELKNGDVAATRVFIDTIERETSLQHGRPADHRAYLSSDNNRITIGAGNKNYFYNNALDQFEIFNGRLTQIEKDLIFKEESDGKPWENLYLHDAGFVMQNPTSRILIPHDIKLNNMADAGGIRFIFEMTDEGGVTSLAKSTYGIINRKDAWMVLIYNGKIMFIGFGNGSYSYRYLVSDSIIEMNKEYNVAINLRGDEIRMAINGIIQSQKIKMEEFKTNTNDIEIGKCCYFNAAPGMHIRRIKIHESAQTDKQLIANTMPEGE